MYSMMYNTIGTGFVFMYGLHVVSVIVFGVGVAFLLFWAFKHLAADVLWKWGWILLVIGVIACLLTLPAWPYFAMRNAWYGDQRPGVPRTAPMMGGWQYPWNSSTPSR